MLNIFKLISLGMIIMLLSACSSKHELVPSPNIYTQSHAYPDVSMPDNLKTTKPKILYVTDRKIVPKKEPLSYGVERSSSMAVGEATVSFGETLSWKDLKIASASKKRQNPITLTIQHMNEVFRFPKTPLPFFVKHTSREENKNILYARKTKLFQNILAKTLADTSQKDVILFIHGFNNTFEDAILSLTDIWHFSNRRGVPLCYTWAAGNSGLLSYFTDRESGEFTIFHLKETIRMIINTPEVKHLHIIAHSRGTDVATTALRELIIEERAKGHNPKKTLKIENLIMAAPDLDYGIVEQRLIAEKFGLAFGQITVYINQSDSALSLSQNLMSGTRFGRITAKDMSSEDKAIFNRVKNVNFIEVENAGGFIGHAYFRKNPAVLSDISLVIQNSSKPGTKGRPLIKKFGNFWLLKKNYPF